MRAGTVRGRSHARLDTNNQDGLALLARPELLLAVVTDGCSQGAASEVGAQLGARVLRAGIARAYATATGPRRAERAFIRGVAHLLRTLRAARAAAALDDAPHPVAEQFLFTALVAMVTETEALIFGCGDGLFAVNGSAVALDSGPDNAPDYLGYRLAHARDFGGARPRRPRPRLLARCDLGQLSSLVIATDGATALDDARGANVNQTVFFGLDALVREPKLETNPSLLQKRLRAIREQTQVLDDDTTLVVIRRRTGAGDVATPLARAGVQGVA